MNHLTIKGQVTVPKNIRDFLGLTAGHSAVEFSINEDGSVLIRKASQLKTETSAPAQRLHSTNRCDQILSLLNGYA